MTQGGLSALDQRLLHVRDTEGSLVGRDDLVVDDRGEVESDIVLGHANLARHLDNLDLDVHGGEALAQQVSLHQTGIDGSFEAVVNLMSVRIKRQVGPGCTNRPNRETRPTSPCPTGL